MLVETLHHSLNKNSGVPTLSLTHPSLYGDLLNGLEVETMRLVERHLVYLHDTIDNGIDGQPTDRVDV